MNRELISVIEQIGREKGIDKEILFEALESALLSASRKSLGPADNVRMHIDRKSGDLRVYCRKKVVEEVTDDKHEISLADRSEEHTSELQSLAYLVCRLLLEKKKNIKQSRWSS